MYLYPDNVYFTSIVDLVGGPSSSLAFKFCKMRELAVTRNFTKSGYLIKVIREFKKSLKSMFLKLENLTIYKLYPIMDDYSKIFKLNSYVSFNLNNKKNKEKEKKW